MNILENIILQYIKKEAILIHFGTAKIHLKHLSNDEIKNLTVLCNLSAKLYNLSLNEVINQYEASKAVIEHQNVIYKIGESDTYKSLGIRYSGIVIEAVANYKKYLKTSRYIATKDKKVIQKKNLATFKPPCPDKVIFPVILVNPSIVGCQITIPSTSMTPDIKVQLPQCYKDHNIRKAILAPQNHFRDWNLTIQYILPELPLPALDRNHVLGIDLGVSNFCTCVSNKGDSFIVDGRRLKSIIQGFSKYNKKFKANGKGETKRKASLKRKTANRIRDYLNKAVAYIVNYCIENHIGTVIVGWGLHFQEFYLGKENNQIFSFFPYAVFLNALKSKCSRHGIICRTTDESFTSQASALDLDKLPQMVTRQEQHFSGHRRYRGLYVSSNKTKINADVNGALNILRKGNAVMDEQIVRLSSRGLAPPRRIYVL